MQPYAVVVAYLGLLGVLVVAGYAFSAAAGLPGAVRSLPFLSGGVPREHAGSRYHARWYALTMVFLAFDMEMVFMYPWAVVVSAVGVTAVVEMLIFLGLILVGVLYAWREGALRWA